VLLTPILAAFHTSFHTVIWLSLLQKPCERPHCLPGQLCETRGCRQGTTLLLAIGFGRGVCRAEGIKEETSLSFSLRQCQMKRSWSTPTLPPACVRSYHMPAPLHKNTL